MAVTHHYVLCPYYQSDKNESITCEDLYRTFREKKKKYWWMRTYCEDAWESCPYAKELNEMYDRIEKGEDMDTAQIEQREKAWKKEQRNLSIQLGTAKKKIERQQKKIDEIMAVNQSFTSVNNKLEAQRKALYKELRKTKEELETVNKTIYAQMMQLTEIYEIRMAYLIEKTGGILIEDDVKEWAEGYEIAIQRDDDEQFTRSWKVIKREVEKDEESDGLDKKTETE